MNKTILGVMLAAALTTCAPAAVVGNGPPNQSGASDMNSYLEADKFTLGSSFDVAQIQF